MNKSNGIEEQPIMKSYWLLLLLTLVAIPLNYLQLLPRRIWNLLRNLLAVFWWTKRNEFNTKTKPLAFIWRPFYYLGILSFKILDLTGIWELLDFILLIFKPNSRSMTKVEIDEALKVYGPDFPYWQIRIDEKSWIAQLGAKFNGTPNIGMGLVLFRSINFNRKLNCEAGNGDMRWLIHELMHVRQMQTLGSAYILESWIAQHYWGYQFGELKNIETYPLEKFNVEQQAEIMKSYYRDHHFGNEPFETYEEAIREMGLGIL